MQIYSYANSITFCILPSLKVRLIGQGIKLPPSNVTAIQYVWVFSSDGGGVIGQWPKQGPHVSKPNSMLYLPSFIAVSLAILERCLRQNAITESNCAIQCHTSKSSIHFFLIFLKFSVDDSMSIT